MGANKVKCERLDHKQRMEPILRGLHELVYPLQRFSSEIYHCGSLGLYLLAFLAARILRIKQEFALKFSS